MTGGGREARVAAALAAPVATAGVRASLGRGAQRMRRHLVLVAAAHLHRHLPPADCTRDVLAGLTRRIESAVSRHPGARGVNAKFIQRDRFCDRIYRRLRGLPGRAPWPRRPDGTLMRRPELELAVASDLWWIAAIQARRDAYSAETEADLETLRDMLVQPMPLDERVRRYAPPLVPPTRIAVPRDLRRASDSDLAARSGECRRRLAALRKALRADVVERARKLAVIHRRLLGVG